MASAITLKTIYKAVDRFSAPLKKMAAASGKFGAKTNLAMAKAERGVRKLYSPMGKLMKRMGGITAIAGGMSLAMAFGAGSRAIVDFDKNLSAASAKFGIFDRQAESYLKLKQVAQEVGATTEFTAGQAAEGLNFLAMAGFTAEQAMASLPGVINLATASQTDLATASDIASDSLGAFNLMTKDSIQLEKNLARVNDVMAKTTSMANTNMEQMFESIKDGAPVATAAGASIETYSALVAGLAGAGIKGSKAGTTLKNMFIKIQNPSSKAASMLKKMGVAVDDGSGNMRDMLDIIADMRKGMAGMGTLEASGVIEEIFGQRAIAGATNLLALENDELKKYRKNLEESTGISKKMAGFMRSGMSGMLAAMKSAWEAVALTIGDTFQPEIDKAIEALTNVARGSGKWLQENKKLIKFIFRIAKYVLYYFAALKALTLIIKTWNMVTKIATAVQWAINAALTANPIGLIIMGIAALIIGLILLVKHWDKVSAKMREWRESAGFQILSILFPILKLIDAIAFIGDRWKAISRIFKEQGIVEGLKAIGRTLLSFVLKPVEVLLKTLAKIPILKDKIAPALEKMTAFRAGLDEGLVEEGKEEGVTAPVNLEATKAGIETERYEEIQKNKLDIELRNKTDKDAEVASNPSAIPVTTTTW